MLDHAHRSPLQPSQFSFQINAQRAEHRRRYFARRHRPVFRVRADLIGRADDLPTFDRLERAARFASSGARCRARRRRCGRPNGSTRIYQHQEDAIQLALGLDRALCSQLEEVGQRET